LHCEGVVALALGSAEGAFGLDGFFVIDYHVAELAVCAHEGRGKEGETW
jgi:hypothetical protein